MPSHEPNARAPSERSAVEAFWTRLEARGRVSRWRNPRVHADVPVCIAREGGKGVQLRSNDLSLLGLQVRCDRRTAARLRPEGDAAAAASAVYMLQIHLALEGETRAAVAAGRMAHITLVPGAAPEEEVAIGFELRSFQGPGRELMERFLAKHLAP